ncbi:unnamed protein product, partial [Ectocarpus sp. 4 AP-2014]
LRQYLQQELSLSVCLTETSRSSGCTDGWQCGGGDDSFDAFRLRPTQLGDCWEDLWKGKDGCIEEERQKNKRLHQSREA